MPVNDHQRIEWSAALRSNLEQLTDLHAIVQERIERSKTCEEALEVALERVEQEKSEEGDALASLSAASEDALRRARLIGVKLEAAFLEGAIPEATYRAALSASFPAGPQSIGATPALRLEALERITRALGQHEDADPGGKLGALAAEGAAAIKDANVGAKQEQEEGRAAAEALTSARAQFDRAYQASKEILSGLLRDAERLNELNELFPDM